MSSGGAGLSGALSGAATGAALGSFIPVVGTAAGALVGGGLGLMQGIAQGEQARIAGEMGAAQLAQQRADRQQALSILQPTQQQIQQLQEAMAVNSQQIGQSQQLLQATNPAIIQAAAQAQGLLQGKDAPMLAPIRNQRAQQRAQLEQSLMQQLGSGYKTSSAGLQALNNFDQQTADLMTNAQQSSIAQLMGYTMTGAGLGAGMQQQGIGNIAALTGQQYGFQQNQASALLGTPVNPGLQYSGDYAHAGAMAGNIQNLMGAGALYAMSGAGRGAGTGTPGQTTSVGEAQFPPRGVPAGAAR